MELLSVSNLKVSFQTKNGMIEAVHGVTYQIREGETVGMVGESGSGKSVTAMSILKLLSSNGKISGGKILFEQSDLTRLKEKQMRSIRGNQISAIFQEPMNSLNPVMTIGNQLAEPFRIHRDCTKEEALVKSVKMLAEVGIPEPEAVIRQYPHQLSGGMRQRVCIAMALACQPKLLIADEPTTALDVTIQAQILKLMNELKQKKQMAILFITHDLGVIRQMADVIAVMYCGQIVEMGREQQMFEESEYLHPYTEGLMLSVPGKERRKGERLHVIPGAVPPAWELPPGCKFAPRCPYAKARCHDREPDFIEVEPGHTIRCFYPVKGAREDGKGTASDNRL